ncbi:hypothetical protein [uncultured Roseobacter sp.]|uniref:hypothetical protein n=1 Tax=uncultured Roseobacter sp. TaxID=114847 RepID=UPI0026153B51|nr:hypothetical protein [uncultured Roseobacter sp.]
MSKAIEIPAGETSKIRVFAINRPVPDMQTLLKSAPVPDVARELLADPHLNTAGAEVFPMADLAGVGLAAYLSDGYAVTDEALSPDRAKLDALEGYVLLVFSDSFAGQPHRLEPGSDVTLIGTYPEFRPGAATGSLTADSALPYTGVPGVVPATSSRNGVGSMVVLTIAAALLLLALWWFLT